MGSIPDDNEGWVTIPPSLRMLKPPSPVAYACRSGPSDQLPARRPASSRNVTSGLCAAAAEDMPAPVPAAGFARAARVFRFSWVIVTPGAIWRCPGERNPRRW